MSQQFGADLIQLTLPVAEHRPLKYLFHKLTLLRCQLCIFQRGIQRALIDLPLCLDGIGWKIKQIRIGKSLRLRPGGDVDRFLGIIQSFCTDLDAA